MVQILRATDMGFCMGVRRAVEIMQQAARPDSPVYSLGEVVHNPHVVRRLEEVGVRPLPGPDVLDGNIGSEAARIAAGHPVAITAHGVGLRVLEDLRARGLPIVDTTCPIVTRAQRYALKFVRDGYHVLIFGDPGHKEVRGIVGWAVDAAGVSRATVAESPALDRLRALIAEFPGGFPSKVGVMAQTTHKMEDFARFVANLMLLQRERNFELHVVNTLCHATTGQQEAAARLARQVDVMIVVGGRKSANTRHLREVCEEQGTPAYHVEGPDDLQPSWFERVERVGITAGASTPDESVDAVEARIRELLHA